MPKLVLAGLLVGNLSAAWADPDELIYRVREQEHLWNICARYVKEPLCWIKLGKYNRIESPNRIDPGDTIRIPYDWLKTKPEPAQVVYRKGELSYIPAAELAKLYWRKTMQVPSLEDLEKVGVTPRALPLDGKIHMGDRVISGDGYARIAFADGSQMTVRPYTDVLFDRVSVNGQSKFVDILVLLKQGATENRVTPKQDKRSRFSIDTPAGVAAVRGTEFRVSVDSGDTAVMHSEVLEGTVVVSGVGDSREQEVNAGYGLRTEQGKETAQPRRLLPALTWTGAAGSRIKRPAGLSWQAIPDAQYYQLDIFDSEGLVASARSEKPNYALSGLEDGEYSVAARAVDDIGLKGLNVSRRFTLYTPLPIPQLSDDSLSVGPSGMVATIRWDPIDKAEGYRIQVATDPAFKQLLRDELITDAGYTYRSRHPVYFRASARFGNGLGEGEMSSVVHWQPEPNYTKVIIGTFAAILAIVIF